jgi:hypothetical protein
MFQYDVNKLKHCLTEILREAVSPETLTWLHDYALVSTPVNRFNAAFVSVPRKTGKTPLQVGAVYQREVELIRPGLDLSGWTVDRLARVWLIIHVDPTIREEYVKRIESLFLAAEVSELVALYSGLPLLAYPESWKARCSEGIRSNIGDVLTAIMCHNPYPAENLDEAAWNQLVLKAIFTEKPVNQITGLDSRANKKLAYTLSDYAHERWAAHRAVNPLLWRCVSPFIDEQILPDIKKVSQSDDPLEREAAALAAYLSHSAEAKSLMPPQLLKKAENGELTWQMIAAKMNNYVLQ